MAIHNIHMTLPLYKKNKKNKLLGKDSVLIHDLQEILNEIVCVRSSVSGCRINSNSGQSVYDDVVPTMDVANLHVVLLV